MWPFPETKEQHLIPDPKTFAVNGKTSNVSAGFGPGPLIWGTYSEKAEKLKGLTVSHV